MQTRTARVETIGAVKEFADRVEATSATTFGRSRCVSLVFLHFADFVEFLEKDFAIF